MLKDGPTSSKKTIIKEIKGHSRLSFTYILLLITSSVLATLGLLMNSTAVIIGAMLISPIFWPVLGISLSAVKSNYKEFLSAFLSLAVTIVIVLGISIGLTVLLPFDQLNEAITARTSPTLIDLFIALTSSVIGIAALYYKRISTSASGAAISIALLPPLCVTGIGIAIGELPIYVGSGLLFLTSTAAILFAGIISLYLFRIKPRSDEDKKEVLASFSVSVLLLILLSIPLTWYLQLSVQQSQLRREINQIIHTQTKEISREAQAKNIVVRFPSMFESDLLEIEFTLYKPESLLFTAADQEHILNQLAQNIDHKLDLTLNIINTVELLQDTDKPSLTENIAQIVQEYTAGLEQQTQVNKIEVAERTNQTLDIELQLLYVENLPISFSQEQELEQLLSSRLQQPVSLVVHLIAAQQLSEPNELQVFALKVREFLDGKYDSVIRIEEVTVYEDTDTPETVTVELDLIAESSFELSVEEKSALVSEIQELLDLPFAPVIYIVVTPVEVY